MGYRHDTQRDVFINRLMLVTVLIASGLFCNAADAKKKMRSLNGGYSIEEHSIEVNSIEVNSIEKSISTSSIDKPFYNRQNAQKEASMITPVINNDVTVSKKSNSKDPFVEFEDVSYLLSGFTSTGLDGPGGIAWLGYDADGDVFFSGGMGAINRMCRNKGDGTFNNVTFEAGLASGGYGPVVAGEIDNGG